MGAVFFAAIVFAGFLAALRAAGFVPAAFFFADFALDGLATVSRFFAGFAKATRFLAAALRALDFTLDFFAALAVARRSPAVVRAAVFVAEDAALVLTADFTRFGAEPARVTLFAGRLPAFLLVDAFLAAIALPSSRTPLTVRKAHGSAVRAGVVTRRFQATL